MVVDVVTLACVSICRRPPNKKWIFGYGKIETVLSYSFSFLLSDVLSRRRQSSHRHRRWCVHAHIHHVALSLSPFTARL